MSLFYISYEVSSSLSSPERAKTSRKNTKLRKVKKAKSLPVENAGNHTPSSTPSSLKRISSLFRSRRPSTSAAITYPIDAEYYSSPSPCNPLAAPSVVPILCTASTRVTASSLSISPVSSSPVVSHPPSSSAPTPLSCRKSWSTNVKRRASQLSQDITTLLENPRCTTGTPPHEIEDFLAGGRENPNPHLYEADMIWAMRGELGLMSLSEMRR